MLVQIHCATVRGLVAAGFKYHAEDKSDSINLSRQITPIISIVAVTVVAFKEDVDAINISWSTKIHLPPHCLMKSVYSYYICPYARRFVSINRVVCNMIWADRICV